MSDERKTQDLPDVRKAVVSASGAGDTLFFNAKAFTKQLAEIEERWQKEKEELEAQILREKMTSAPGIAPPKILPK